MLVINDAVGAVQVLEEICLTVGSAMHNIAVLVRDYATISGLFDSVYVSFYKTPGRHCGRCPRRAG